MSNSIRFVGRFYVLSLLAAAVTFWVGLAAPAGADVVDISNATVDPSFLDGDGCLNIDAVDNYWGTTPPNSARLIGPTSQAWWAGEIYSDVDVNGQVLTDQAGGNRHTWHGALSGSGTFLIQQSVGGTVFAGTSACLTSVGWDFGRSCLFCGV